jgi:enoyl-CoA hydratase
MQDILFETAQGKEGQVGLITLNRPKALNALTHSMLKAMHENLVAWEKNHSIQAVIIEAVPGRAFCAGGDVRAIYEKKLTKDPRLTQFFHDEYALNEAIYNFSKPYIAFLNGITMGGGAGISIHGKYPIGTEHLSFAMPETTIGFFPDVGSTYFLSRLTGCMGIYLGLTGTTITYADCAALALIKYVCKSEELTAIKKSIIESPSQIEKILANATRLKLASALMLQKDTIARAFNATSVEEIFINLEKIGDTWALNTLQQLKKKSPTSLKVTLKALQKARELNFSQCIALEKHLMENLLARSDFFEGVRALLIDKDNNPEFQPAKLSEVNQDLVEDLIN